MSTVSDCIDMRRRMGDVVGAIMHHIIVVRGRVRYVVIVAPMTYGVIVRRGVRNRVNVLRRRYSAC